ncbi:MAG: hypothetical protein FWF29_12100 [Treponema sp.]|nr:hypothetical protein [Treponema sp.]
MKKRIVKARFPALLTGVLDGAFIRFYYKGMKIKRLFFPALLIFIFSFPIAAQDASKQTESADKAQTGSPVGSNMGSPGESNAGSPEGSAVFAPFVTRLQGEVKNNLIRLSWMDSPDIKGSVYIYRSPLPFDTDSSVTGIRPIEIPYGVQNYVDEIENPAAIYYFAAASDETGKIYNIPIAFTNTLTVRPAADANTQTNTGTQVNAETQANTGANAAPLPLPPPIKTPPAGSTGTVITTGSTGGITSLKTSAQGDSVIISFTADDEKSVILYRSTRAIKQTQDLLGAVIVQTKIKSPYTDSPAPGIPWFYAVVAEEDISRGAAVVIPDQNATSAPVIVPAGTASTGSDRNMRAMPLPQISVETAIPGAGAYDGTPRQSQLSQEAGQALEKIPATPKTEPLPRRPRVFARDLQDLEAGVPNGSEDYLLSLIIKGSFMARNWEAARDELVKFLALPRQSECAARAKFYLGQCYYFLGQYRDGLFEFLAIQNRYPNESMEWIQASLDILKN